MNTKINLTTIVAASLLIGVISGKFFLSLDLDKYDQGFQAGFASGYKQGKADALLPQETNHELQEVCLSIWIGNQIREQK
jgi:hypothetical protein